MERHSALSGCYQDSVAVRKVREGARRVVVADKDGCIQPHPHPVVNPSPSAIAAGKEIRRKLEDGCVFVESSAQTVELSISSSCYEMSASRYGLNRPQPKIRLADGTITRKPEDVPEWSYLRDPDVFAGFGSGLYLRANGGYHCDWEFDKALGGPAWRERVGKDLDVLYQWGNFKRYLGAIDREGLFESGEVDVSPLAYRFQFLHKDRDGIDALVAREQLRLTLLLLQQERGYFKDVELVDESFPNQGNYTTYLVSTFGQKHMVLERFGNHLSVTSGVPVHDIEYVIIGDSPTDLECGLGAFWGAKNATFIVAADSRLNESIRKNKSKFGGMPLPGSLEHRALPGQYYPTDVPGEYWWRGQSQGQARKVILAHDAPYSKGLACTESVLACLEHLGF